MAESATNRRLLKALKGLHPIRVENMCSAGTPDVNFAGGWIECKCVLKYPVRPETPIRIPHWSPEQKLWHRMRAAAGERTWVFVQVERDYYLFDGVRAAALLGDISEQGLVGHCLACWRGSLNDEQLRTILRQK
jgi:hypothetical protein